MKPYPFPKAGAQWYSIKREDGGNSDETTLYFYDVIGIDWEGTAAKEIVPLIDKITSPIINVRVDSPGGSVFDGHAIFNSLRRNSAKKVVHIDGHAFSIASLIAMAGDEIHMAENSMFMIHDPMSGFAFGNARDLRREADILDQVKQSMLNTMESRTGRAREVISAAMEKETYFSAQEAKEWGLATHIHKSKPIAAVDRNVMVALGIKRIPGESESSKSAHAPHASTDTFDLDLLRKRIALREKTTPSRKQY